MVIRLNICTDSERWIVVCIARNNRPRQHQFGSIEIDPATTTGRRPGRCRRRVRGDRRLIDGEFGGVDANATSHLEAGIARERRIIHNGWTGPTDAKTTPQLRSSVRIEGAVRDRD